MVNGENGEKGGGFIGIFLFTCLWCMLACYLLFFMSKECGNHERDNAWLVDESMTVERGLRQVKPTSTPQLLPDDYLLTLLSLLLSLNGSWAFKQTGYSQTVRQINGQGNRNISETFQNAFYILENSI